MHFRLTVGPKPDYNPQSTEKACNKKGILPVFPVVRNNKRDKQRCQQRPDIRPSVKNSCCQRPFLLWKPFSYSFNCSRKVARFTKTKPHTCNSKTNPTHRLGNQGM